MPLKIEIDWHNFSEWLKGAQHCRNLVFQSLDLRDHDEKIASLPQAEASQDGSVFLGCKIGPRLLAAAGEHYGLIFPGLSDRPYNAYRQGLYTAEELFDNFDPSDPESYRKCMDWRTFVSFIKVGSDNKPLKPIQYVEVGADEVLARRLHDHFIENETDDFLKKFTHPPSRGIVAVMGGHDRGRSDAAYHQVAHLTRLLNREGFLVVSGGGPGLMEATNLGAYFGAFDDETLLDKAISRLKDADKFDHPNWLSVAWSVRKDFPRPDPTKGRSLGIPTWFYGHEPPNVFATHIAKYFENSIREEGLLAIATHGIVFAEGNAGTVQEIFQDGCQNYYENYGFKSPMILFGKAYWNPTAEKDNNYPEKHKPVWPLLRKLAQEKKFEDLLLLTDDTGEILEKIRSFKPPE